MPPSELHEQILAAYLDGAQSPFSIARDFGLTIEQFIAFITSPEIAARIRALETLCRERARTLAILHLPEAARVLANALRSPSPVEARRAASALVREAHRPAPRPAPSEHPASQPADAARPAGASHAHPSPPQPQPSPTALILAADDRNAAPQRSDADPAPGLSDQSP